MPLLNEIAKSYDKRVNVLLRITPGIECHTHEYIQTGHLDSKFGFDLTQIDTAVESVMEEYKTFMYEKRLQFLIFSLLRG